MTNTPLAAAVPYSADAEGPFRMSTDSISSGLIPLKLLMRCVEKFPGAGELSIRTPSTTISGSFDRDSELLPRIRMDDDVPVCPDP